MFKYNFAFIFPCPPGLLEWLGSRVAHLVDGQVLPLLEGLATLVTDVVPHLWEQTRDQI